jgi:hypothetical protein
MPAIKLLIHSVISDNAKWMTVDIKDYYLNTPLLRPEYDRRPRYPVFGRLYCPRYLVLLMFGDYNKLYLLVLGEADAIGVWVVMCEKQRADRTLWILLQASVGRRCRVWQRDMCAESRRVRG